MTQYDLIKWVKCLEGKINDIQNSWIKTVKVNTFADALNTAKGSTWLLINVAIDETHGNWPNAIYLWDGESLQWGAFTSEGITQPS